MSRLNFLRTGRSSGGFFIFYSSLLAAQRNRQFHNMVAALENALTPKLLFFVVVSLISAGVVKTRLAGGLLMMQRKGIRVSVPEDTGGCVILAAVYWVVPKGLVTFLGFLGNAEFSPRKRLLEFIELQKS